MRPGPLAGRYPAVAGMVMFALIPYLALSAALNPLTPIISQQLHMSLQTLSLSAGLGNAAYAVGTVLAVQFAQHLPQRRMLVGYAALLLIGSLLCATAQDAGMFIAGHIIQGLCTSLLLIAAVPPLAIGFPKDKLRDTAVIMNICIFGAVALGPFIGGLQAQATEWRPLFWIVACVSAGALILSVLTFDDAPPANPNAPRDLPAIGLAAVGCVAAFFGASELTSHAFLSAITIIPLLGGLAVIVVLVAYQYVAKNPLLTVKVMLTSSMPVAGIIVALFAAAASVSATALTAEALTGRYSPVHIGLLYTPEALGAVITAVALGIVISRRALHYLPLVGMISLAAGIAVFRIDVPSSQAATLIGSGLTGIGLGATVAPALFVAGFSLPAADLQRVFAIVELMRAVAAFMIAPIFVHYAVTVGGSLDSGTGSALWIGLAIAIVGAVVGVGVYAFSGARPQTPNLDGFLAGVQPAWYSPPLLARLRHGVEVGTPPAATVAAVADAAAGAAAAGAGAAAAANGSNGSTAANGSPTGAPQAAGNGSSTGVPLATGNGSSQEPPATGNGSSQEPPAASDTAAGPVLFAYDGSDLAKQAIERAGHQLAPGREALVVCVWRPVDVGFVLDEGQRINADEATEVHAAAEQVAAQGVALAEQAGFSARAITVEAAPIWRGLTEVAQRHGANLIVLGTHRRKGVTGHLVGSVTADVLEHSDKPVLVVHASS